MAQCRPGHEEHMCQLIATNEPMDSIKDLVRDARFICGRCKRVAHDECNLCDPQPLD